MAQGRILIFQYGSNMDPDRLNSAARLGGAAEVVGAARLPGWGIRFDLYSESNRCAVTDIVPSAEEQVEGVLYRVPYRMVVAPKSQRSAMDRIEGAGLGSRSNYKRRRIWVLRDGKTVEARTYVGTPSGRKRFCKDLITSAESVRIISGISSRERGDSDFLAPILLIFGGKPVIGCVVRNDLVHLALDHKSSKKDCSSRFAFESRTVTSAGYFSAASFIEGPRM
jgi:hypothetical protein